MLPHLPPFQGFPALGPASCHDPGAVVGGAALPFLSWQVAYFLLLLFLLLCSLLVGPGRGGGVFFVVFFFVICVYVYHLCLCSLNV